LRNKETWNPQEIDRMNTESEGIAPTLHKTSTIDFYSRSGMKCIGNKNPRKRCWISGAVPDSDLKKVKKTTF